MTTLAEVAIAELVKLPEDEQNEVATLMLAEINSEREWNAAFHAKADQISSKAKAALEAFKRGRTDELTIDRL